MVDFFSNFIYMITAKIAFSNFDILQHAVSSAFLFHLASSSGQMCFNFRSFASFSSTFLFDFLTSSGQMCFKYICFLFI